ncbi:hypothetical protein cyc_00522 [Cyclospora cayetanensis]|uniref:Uncharacterized protein n=1 Tax=Cyclospora cayetanensis TaxID=88456 RepID=A0A1D3D8K2_9EIME|nr:hypothetical protein cyc_00522 [Cyclospora cayetanensis]
MTAIAAAAHAPEQQHRNLDHQGAIVGVPAYLGFQAIPFKAHLSHLSPEPVSQIEAPERVPDLPSCTGVFNCRDVIAQHR